MELLILRKVKHDVKERLTLSSSGTSGGEGARTHVQVLANSGVASALVLLHLLKDPANKSNCWLYGSDLLVVGIVRYQRAPLLSACAWLIDIPK